MQKLYEKYDNLHSPAKDELLDLLVKLLQGFNEAYIIIDALDECDEYGHLFDVINSIYSRQLSHLHLLVSSRRDQDIQESMERCTTAEIHLSADLVGDDIVSYVNAAVIKEHKFRKWGHAVQGQIKGALVSGANGMFRWVACQIEELRHCPSKMVLIDTLTSLPKDLEDIYDQILQRIHRNKISSVNILLTWLIFGMCPLRLEELAVVMTFNPTNGTFDTGLELPHPDDIIQLCSSLVTKTNHNTVVLAHASVKEYFLSRPRRWGKGITAFYDPSAGHALIAHCCLRYLIQHEWYNEALQIGYVPNFPLLQYSACFWPDHYSLSSKDYILQKLLMMLFDGDRRVFSSWVMLCNKTRWLPRQEPSIAYAGFLGLEDIVQALVMKNGWSNEHSITMQFASMNGYSNVVKLLLDKGADVNDKHALNGLYFACSKGHTEIVKLLLDMVVDVNAHWQVLDGLNIACRRGHTDIVKLLLAKGADVNAQQALDGLNVACESGHTEIVKLLLGKHVMNAKETLNDLFDACDRGHTEIVMLLLDKGTDSDVNAQQALDGLNIACEKGHTEIVKLLLDKGVDVNHQQALDVACQRGYTEIVKFLLDKGVDLDGNQTLAGLYFACGKGHTQIVKLLLSQGADVNTKQALNGLCDACSEGHIEIVKLLLEKGADINATEMLAGLHFACEKGHTEIVKLLLDKRADVNSPNFEFDEAFNDAQCGGHTEIIQLLLANRAKAKTKKGRVHSDITPDMNAQQLKLDGLNVACEKSDTEIVKLILDKHEVNAEQALDALKVACEKGHTEIVRLLLDKGVDLNGNQILAGLYFACGEGHTQIVKLLLNKGADVNTKQALNGLCDACSRGHMEIVKLLLDRGADVNATEMSAGLHFACEKGHTEIVKLLLDKGADVNSPSFEFDVALNDAQCGGYTKVTKLLLDKREKVKTPRGKK